MKKEIPSSVVIGISVLVLLAIVVIPTTTYGQITTNTTSTINTTNATAPPATNATTTRIITDLTWFDGQVDVLSPQNIQYQQTDPAFAKLAQTTSDCLNDYNQIFAKIQANPQFRENPGSGTAYTAEDINRQDLCTDVIRQGMDQFCESTDFATFDIQKCEEARKIDETYIGVVEVIFG